MKRTVIPIFIALLFLTPVLFADPVEISYDSGNPSGYFNQTNRGDIEVVHFTPAHPCSLLSFRFRVQGTGEMEWHVWGDNGGNMCNPENDLIEPVLIDVEDDASWITIDISEASLKFDIPQHFHIGYVKQDGDPRLLLDGGNNFETRSHLRIGNSWYVAADGAGNYLLRVTVEYYNEIDEEDFAFHNVNEETGVRGMSRIAWGDYDNDGWEDMLVQGRLLFRNLGDGTFAEVGEDAGISQDNPSNSGTWGDFDNDGWLDIFTTTSNLNVEDRLYHNNGDGTFSFANNEYWLNNGRDETQASGWGDADGDGNLELYIANSELWNDGNPIFYRDYFYRFDTIDNIFIDETPPGIEDNRHYGRGVAWCDIDMDGDMDIYISNYRLHPNYLLINWGDFIFTEEAAHRGVQGVRVQGAYGHTIGSSWADYDNDGDFDLFVANLAHPRYLAFSDKCMLYRNLGEEAEWTFEDVREDAGIAFDETASSPAWGDYDNDGWLDLFVSSVYEGRQPYLYRNQSDGTFINVNYPAGFHTECYNSWGVAWCDYDHDGDLDIAVGGGHGGLFQNSGDIGHWIQIELRGVTSNRFGFGSQASVHSGDLHMLRQVEGGMGTGGCQNMFALHYGLGGSIYDDEYVEVDSLIINWIGGGVDRYFRIGADRRYFAIQGEGLLEAPSINRRAGLPDDFKLADPYPNPFNSRLTIEFNLSLEGVVKVVLYDLSGRPVTVLTDRNFESGTQSLTWDAGNMPAGCYLLQVTHPSGVISRTVTLLK
ncbi:VCBS repeat-containing protein [bacterium]|nr:VCBS repeat-containing protein [bacterium]